MRTKTTTSNQPSQYGYLSKEEENREIPIVFFQDGDAKHLPYTLWQACHWAQGNPVIVLGDNSNRYYPGVIHVPWQEYSRRVSSFRKVYKHMSSNPERFEFLCFCRWLVIQNFSERTGIKEFLYLDSDVLIFDQPKRIAPKKNQYRLGLTWLGELNTPTAEVSPATVWFKNPEALSRYNEMVFLFYKDKQKFVAMKEKASPLVKNKMGGVCDMWFWRQFVTENAEEVYNLWNPEKSGVVDINIADPTAFLMEHGIKKICYKNGQPYGYHIKRKKWIRFGTLHFVGLTKEKLKISISQKMKINTRATIFLGKIKNFLKSAL